MTFWQRIENCFLVSMERLGDVTNIYLLYIIALRHILLGAL